MATELVDASKLDACCTAEANAIRAKTGSSAQIAYDWANSKGFADAIAAIPTGGGVSLDDFVSGTEPTGAVTLTTATSIRDWFFYKTSITSISGSAVATVGENAFRSLNSLTSVSLNNATELKNECFRECGNLTSVSFPNVTTLTGEGMFRQCGKLITASLPKATVVQTYLFYNNQKLTTVDVSLATEVKISAFQQCYALELLDLPKVTKIYNNAFYNARVLYTLILRHTSVVTLDNVGAFTNTPVRGYNGSSATIFVPQNLIATYKTASNWSSIFNEGHVTFSAIEGSIYE